jgi:hypothetical protein
MTWESSPVSNDRHPRPIVYLRASTIADPRGMRAVVGSRTLGWRGDLRADGPVMQQGRTYVPVLTEHDWYRAEAEQVEVFAPLVPIERVWIETPGDYASSDPNGPNASSPVPASQERRITGRRVVHVLSGREEKEERDLRAISELVPDGYENFVLVTSESDWYRWASSGKIAPARSLSPHDLWIE